jgi:hypothetical protein
VLGRPQVLAAVVSRRSGQTVFVRLGDLPLLALAAGGLLMARWRRRGRYRDPG